MGHVSSSGTTSHTLSLEVYPMKDMREGAEIHEGGGADGS